MQDKDIFPKPNPYTDSPFTKWINKLLAGCVACMVRSSTDIKVKRTKEGTYLELDRQWKNTTRWNYEADGYHKHHLNTGKYIPDDHYYFNPRSEYSVGDVVRVDKLYYAGKDPVTDDYMYVYPGVYVCVQNVPRYDLPVNVQKLMTDKGAPKSIYRQENIVYAPLYPEPYRLASRNVFNDPQTPAAEDYRSYQGRYWELISLFPTKGTICVNGEMRDGYINGTVTPGSPSEADAALPGIEIPT